MHSPFVFVSRKCPAFSWSCRSHYFGVSSPQCTHLRVTHAVGRFWLTYLLLVLLSLGIVGLLSLVHVRLSLLFDGAFGFNLGDRCT